MTAELLLPLPWPGSGGYTGRAININGQASWWSASYPRIRCSRICSIQEKKDGLMQLMDKLNAQLRREKVKLAAQGFGRSWKLWQEKISPCNTTLFEDVIVINASYGR
jgi:hypothetical protein